MAKDIIHEDDWGMEEVERPAAPPKVKRSASGGGGGNGMKDYVIVALIAIIAVMGINNFIYARTSPAGIGGGGCCGSGGGRGAASGPSSAELERIGLEFYVETTGETNTEGVQAVVQDFGCHQEIYILKDGQRVMRIGYAYGQVYQMS